MRHAKLRMILRLDERCFVLALGMLGVEGCGEPCADGSASAYGCAGQEGADTVWGDGGPDSETSGGSTAGGAGTAGGGGGAAEGGGEGGRPSATDSASDGFGSGGDTEGAHAGGDMVAGSASGAGTSGETEGSSSSGGLDGTGGNG